MKPVMRFLRKMILPSKQMKMPERLHQKEPCMLKLLFPGDPKGMQLAPTLQMPIRALQSETRLSDKEQQPFRLVLK